MMKNCQRNDAEFQTPYFSAPSACAVHLHWLDWTHCSILHRFEWGKLTVFFHGCQVGSCEEFLYPLMISCSYGIDGPFIDDLLSCMMIPHDFFWEHLNRMFQGFYTRPLGVPVLKETSSNSGEFYTRWQNCDILGIIGTKTRQPRDMIEKYLGITIVGCDSVKGTIWLYNGIYICGNAI